MFFCSMAQFEFRNTTVVAQQTESMTQKCDSEWANSTAMQINARLGVHAARVINRCCSLADCTIKLTLIVLILLWDGAIAGMHVAGSRQQGRVM
jgi:hypothetical protein